MFDERVAKAEMPDISIRREVFTLLAQPMIGFIQLGKDKSHLCSISDCMCRFSAMSVSCGSMAETRRHSLSVRSVPIAVIDGSNINGCNVPTADICG